MTPDRTDLTAELKRLRRGYGLTEQAVADSPVLLEALGNPPLKEAVNRLRNVLRGLGDHEPARVIRIAYGVEGRADLVLSARREAYKQDTGRDIKTLIRYEDKMIDELAVQLLSLIFNLPLRKTGCSFGSFGVSARQGTATA